MILKQTGYAYNDITLVPERISNVTSRSECNPTYNGYLPIFVAPMSSVINDKNCEIFEQYMNTVIPRSVDIDIRKDMLNNVKGNRFIALSLREFFDLFVEPNDFTQPNKVYNVCVDIANGHMQHLYDLCKAAKEKSYSEKYSISIMTGNIANPQTYYEICNMTLNYEPIIDYIRIGIGGGSGCITSSNVSVHYPMASLIDDCNKLKREHNLGNKVKIIADGGIRNYSDVIKALALGADYVMIGGLFAKCLESAGAKMFTNYKGEKEMCSSEAAYELYEKGAQLYTRFYGMASADGQIAINHKKTKTAEGITKMLPVEYKLHKWVENMKDYLKSAMSYCDCKKLEEFVGEQILIINSPAEIAAVNK